LIFFEGKSILQPYPGLPNPGRAFSVSSGKAEKFLHKDSDGKIDGIADLKLKSFFLFVNMEIPIEKKRFKGKPDNLKFSLRGFYRFLFLII
jgi:hypothetical protein